MMWGFAGMMRCLAGMIAIAALLYTNSASAAMLSGSVHDPSNAAAFNAQISAKNEATAEVHRTRADDDGRFLLELPPGAYAVEIALAGFVTVERRVSLDEQHPVTLEIKLELAETRSEVSVRGKGES